MFTGNIDLNSPNIYSCGKAIGNYLTNNRIPLLSRTEDVLYFSKTELLQLALDSMPFYLKALSKVGVING